MFVLFVAHLNDLNRKSHIIISQLNEGLPVTRPINVKYIANSERIKIASSQLDLVNINSGTISYTMLSYNRDIFGKILIGKSTC